jgi:short-subunit dehydrogenase
MIISSMADFRGGADEAVYAATKFAQVGLGGTLDRELRAQGVRVPPICPIGTSTEFAMGAGRREGSPGWIHTLRPDDVAHAVRVVLEQPRSIWTTVWQLWSMGQQSRGWLRTPLGGRVHASATHASMRASLGLSLWLSSGVLPPT